MGRDRHSPPPGLTEEECRCWQQQARKFVWMDGGIKIIKPSERSENRGEEPHEGREDEQPEAAGER